MVLTRSYGASDLSPVQRLVAALSSKVVSQPRMLSNFNEVRMSASRGTLVRETSPSARRQAMRMGRAAFFAPLTRMVPWRGTPPSMISLSIGYLFILVLLDRRGNLS